MLIAPRSCIPHLVLLLKTSSKRTHAVCLSHLTQEKKLHKRLCMHCGNVVHIVTTISPAASSSGKHVAATSHTKGVIPHQSWLRSLHAYAGNSVPPRDFLCLSHPHIDPGTRCDRDPVGHGLISLTVSPIDKKVSAVHYAYIATIVCVRFT